MDSPALRQMLVASSPQLVSLSVGSITGFSNVILEQLKSTESTIPVDLETISWIGSVHGLAGLPSVIMPLIMRWRGRKFTYIASCLILIIGWILIYIASDVTTIIIAECFHGFGINSITTVSFSTISEMIDPKYRTISMTCYMLNLTFGLSFTGIIGRYLHWKTVSLIMSTPVLIALIIGCIWPESPAWLAYKGEYFKCEQAFKWLRGTDEDSQKELKELLNAHKENYISIGKNKNLKYVWMKITRKDFYLPCLHIFMTLGSFYFGGVLVMVIYGSDIIRTASNNNLSAVRYGMIVNSVFSYVGSLITIMLLKLFNNKSVYISTGISSTILMLGAAIALILQSLGFLSNDSLIVVYLLSFFILSEYLGTATMCFPIAGELMPVKHRGLGEIIYIVLLSGLDSLVLKVSPYLMLYLGLWRLFILFAIGKLLCIIYFWRFVPETKGKTLQQIEDFYNYGGFVNRNDEEVECIKIGCKDSAF